ncbi:MAG: tRNA (adenosine(37)-N6)-threonylcarbamoyltransferase complex dimerization subunit type 1 TsaB [Chloroflexi bacterium]|nr:tRNA (adenosine(37)-N6)-threonylcarbamoyltransferase complex dimerization subunit type 1 TsaB [Chloroflexota bacterium]
MTAPDGPVLAIDTASAEATLGVVTGEAVTAERRWTVETNYSRELLAGIDAVLRDAGVMRDDLAAVAVDAGPGGYGGLRSGVATAQGLAFALDLPLAGVSRLELAALPHLDEERPVVAVHAAGGNRVAWAAYLATAAAPEIMVEPRLEAIEDCVERAPVGALWCGEVTAELASARDAAREGDADVAPADNVRRAADLVRLARLHEAFGDAGLVDVVYLRPPPITRSTRR